jgi:elongation factor G
VRVYSGKAQAGLEVYNPGKGRKERVNRLLRMFARDREEIQELGAGDIGARW